MTTEKAVPRGRTDLDEISPCPAVVTHAEARGVREILHFTPTTGLAGIFASGSVKSRASLPLDQQLEHVYRPNTVNEQRQRDLEWHDYVNLSISRINKHMFNYSNKTNAHHDPSWVVLVFSVNILSAPGVVFASTNNTYSGCVRFEGDLGFSRLFEPSITRWSGSAVGRLESHERSWPTDRQAEVLYPFALSLEHLDGLVARDDRGCDDINGVMGVYDQQVSVRIDEGYFNA